MAETLHKHIDLRQTSANTYSAGWHNDWNVGKSLHGGHVAAIVHLAASTHLSSDPTLAKLNQPDILNLHFEFLRSGEHSESIVTVNTVKLGTAVSTLQLELSQRGKTKVIALATSVNFDHQFGPSKTPSWSLLPPPPPTPDFTLIEAEKPEPNWLSWYTKGEIMPFAHRLSMLIPRRGITVDWLADAWNRAKGDERMDAHCLTFMTDVFPCMADTLMQNKGFYDAHNHHATIKRWEEANPGVPAAIHNSFAQVKRTPIMATTVNLDIEFKRRVPKEGLGWIFTRVATHIMHNGRMDLQITICDENMELLCVASQRVLALEAGRKFEKGTTKPAL